MLRPSVFGSMAALIVLSAPAAAGPAVTIYARDLGFVRESLAFDVAGARDTLRLLHLPRRVDVTSLRFAPEGGARVTRLAYVGNLLSGERAMDRARGSRVRVVAEGDRSVEGELLSVDGTWVLVRGDDGRLHDVSRESVLDVELPESAADGVLHPTLEVALDGTRKGTLAAELSYLTGGLSWSAEHTVIRRGETRVEWSAAATVTNASGTEFVNATLKLVAGDPRRQNAPSPLPVRAMMETSSMQQKADLAEETFSEYHLYSLPRPATLHDNEAQQLTMIEPHDVRVAPRYLYRGGGNEVLAQLVVKNTKAAGLGVPLPGGRVRIYAADAGGALQFTGESGLRHTPESEEVTLDVGTAFDLVAERRDLSNRRTADREREIRTEITLRNRKKEGATIALEVPMPGEFEIIESSQKWSKKDARTLQMDVAVPAGKEVKVTYAARITY